MSVFAHHSFSLYKTIVLRIDVLQGVKKKRGEKPKMVFSLIKSNQARCNLTYVTEYKLISYSDRVQIEGFVWS
jgi:hypothetical protein